MENILHFGKYFLCVFLAKPDEKGKSPRMGAIYNIAKNMIQSQYSGIPRSISLAAKACSGDPQISTLLGLLDKFYREQIRRDLSRFFSVIDIQTLIWFLGVS
jgi:hypothetical protein